MDIDDEPIDWYDAFGKAVHQLGKKWPDPLTKDEYDACEQFADSKFSRPHDEAVIVRCSKHGDAISVNGQPRNCISCDGGVF